MVDLENDVHLVHEKLIARGVLSTRKLAVLTGVPLRRVRAALKTLKERGHADWTAGWTGQFSYERKWKATR